jgi:hypothetical protein
MVLPSKSDEQAKARNISEIHTYRGYWWRYHAYSTSYTGTVLSTHQTYPYHFLLNSLQSKLGITVRPGALSPEKLALLGMRRLMLEN